MQVYVNSKGVEFCAVGDVVLRTGSDVGVVKISRITQDQLVNGSRLESLPITHR